MLVEEGRMAKGLEMRVSDVVSGAGADGAPGEV